MITKVVAFIDSSVPTLVHAPTNGSPMSFSFKITRPRARLEASFAAASSFSRVFGLIRYESSSSNARWWQRTIFATDGQWLRLQGRQGTNPVDTWHMLLEHRDRPVIPLPILALADFVAHEENLADPKSWWHFHWFAWALENLLNRLPASPYQSGGLTMLPQELDSMVQAIIDALLTGAPTIPWPTTDGTQLQTLVHLGEHVWSFPPALVRQLVDATVLLDERGSETVSDVEDTVSTDDYDKKHILTTPGQLVELSGWYCWRRQVPQVRGLTIRTSALHFPLTVRQAFVLTHPDAPSIEDADLAVLCDGIIGNSSQRSFIELFEDDETINMSDMPGATHRAGVLASSQEAGTGTHTPIGHWDIPPSLCSPLFATLSLRAVRLLSTTQGFWVRLIPNDGEWGVILWWTPQLDPSLSFAFALGTERNHEFVWSFHEVLWGLWRDIRLSGAPCGLGSS